MSAILVEAVTKVFRHRPALFNWMGREAPGETRALSEVSLAAAAGEILVLLGPNGSGKTTLLKLVSTMLLPDRGRIQVEGNDTRTAAHEVRSRVGFAIASERSFFPRLTARENLNFFATLNDLGRSDRAAAIERVLDETGLIESGDMLVQKFSTGMYQRLAIARALLKRPSILLLDEPTRSIDLGAATRLWQLLRRTAGSGTTVLLATHNLQEAVAVGAAVTVLRRGRVVGHRRLGHETSVEELQQFYLHEVEPEMETEDLLPRSAS
ncbi:MAG TPA: ABC transporter ATP-binding protein [Terriglobales bacterium]|nr:ABC transporter ATP-binding protein [Terriglobales bacterium]